VNGLVVHIADLERIAGRNAEYRRNTLPLVDNLPLRTRN